ncbi:cysteine-rich small domain-containing protein [Pseudodesulfovibrio tunisiensis]|uniref:cysteine-rich small domain-containing protein n=1 Tax=Pseudodesulfovibrio tunisiensis TaxID=463192 RepID=UPI001FB5631D|nr:cysteine-rich small domain-containing protein [Pseudodesulfovibrio tunisiensis]
MKNSYRFFCNTDCEYFPCHKTARPEEFNCLFCFCPLYFLEECGGNHSRTEQGVKDCTNCLIPHTPKGYDYILKKLRERFELIRAGKG